jgi:putative IMPACT (imprinted ancient) family translation regulator
MGVPRQRHGIKSELPALERAEWWRSREARVGMIILRMLEREGIRDHIVVVTRCFGGKQLGGDRCRHLQKAVRIYLNAL